MTSAELPADAFGRVRDVVHDAVKDLKADQLSRRVNDEANSIAWLVWHLTRIQDDHVAGITGAEQVWTAQDWVQRFALPFDVGDTGYGHGLPRSRPSSPTRSPCAATTMLCTTPPSDSWSSLTDVDLDRVVDEEWDPPVTMGVRLVSVINDDMQHAGQAAFARGVLSDP